MLKLTLNILDNCLEGIVLASGLTTDDSNGLHITGSGKELRWVLKIGGNHDWAVYCLWAENTIDRVIQNGDKVCLRRNIKNIIEINDEVWKRYRF